MHYNDLTTPDPKAIIIAEAGINHDGDIEKALRMIDVAAEAGADYVKFQSFQAQKLVTPDALTSSYIKEGSNEGESFEDLLRRLQLSPKIMSHSRNIVTNRVSSSFRQHLMKNPSIFCFSLIRVSSRLRPVI